MSERIWPDGKKHPEHPSGIGFEGGFGFNHGAQPGWSRPEYVAPFPPPEPKPAKKAAEHPSGPFPDVDIRVHVTDLGDSINDRLAEVACLRAPTMLFVKGQLFLDGPGFASIGSLVKYHLPSPVVIDPSPA